MKVSGALVELYEIRHEIKALENRARQLSNALLDRNLPSTIQTRDGEVKVKIVECDRCLIPEYWRASFTAIRFTKPHSPRRRMKPGSLRK